MASNGERAYHMHQAGLGQSEGPGEWLAVTQERINVFADVTEDQQFLHVDPEACKTLSPWGVPIAHGFLTLSLLTKLAESVPQPPERLEGIVMGVNYGFDKVRFVNPVKVGSKIRAASTVKSVESKGASIQVTKTYTIEVEGEDKPAVVADWVTRIFFGG